MKPALSGAHSRVHFSSTRQTQLGSPWIVSAVLADNAFVTEGETSELMPCEPVSLVPGHWSLTQCFCCVSDTRVYTVVKAPGLLVSH